MKKIVFVLPTIESGGAEKHCIQLANYLQSAHQYRITLFVFDDSKFYRDLIDKKIELIQLSIPISSFNKFKKLFYIYIKYSILFSKNVNILNYDFIVAAYEGIAEIVIYINYLRSVFSKKNGRNKYVLIIQTSILNLITHKKKFTSRMWLRLINRIRLIISIKTICCSDSVLEELDAKQNKTNYTVINNFVNISATKSLSINISDNQTKEILFYGDYFINIGRFSVQKNQIFLVHAFERICHQSKYNLLLIGNEQDGYTTHYIKKFVIDKKLDKRIFLLGEKINPFPYLANSKAFLFTSQYEGFPLVLLECMALGIPIITTKYAGYANLVNSQNAIIIEKDDINAYSTKMLHIEKKMGNMNSQIINAKKYSQQYDINIIGEQYRNYFEKI